MVHFRLHIFRLLPMFAIAIGTAACEAPKRKADYFDAHPLQVTQGTVELAIGARVEFEPMSSVEAANLQQFVGDYLTRGAGPITIQMHRREAAGGDADARVRKMQTILNRAGISSGDINVLPLGTTAPRAAAVVLAFRAHTAIVPECGDWSSNPTANWSNRSQANFGCATQRNLGLTVANPSDLKKAATMSNSDANRGERILNSYQSGATAGGDGAAAEGGAATP